MENDERFIRENGEKSQEESLRKYKDFGGVMLKYQ